MGFDRRKGVARRFRQPFVAAIIITFATLLCYGLSSVSTVAANALPDLLPPSVPTDGSPHDEYEVTDDFDFTWHASTDDSEDLITYAFRSSREVNTLDTQPEIQADTLTEPEQHFTGASDGMWYWQVRATDATGKQSAWSDVWKVVVDTKDPTAEFFVPAEGEVFGGAEDVTVTAKLSDESGIGHYDVYMDGAKSSQPVTTDESSPTSHTISAVFHTQDLTEGAHVVRVRVTDKAGRKNESQRTFTVDKTPPIFVITAPTGIVGGDSVTIHGSASDETALAEYYYQVYDGNNTVMGDSVGIASTPVIEGVLGTWSISGYPSGTYLVKLWGSDQAGNNSSFQTSFMIDHTEPVANLRLTSSAAPTASTPISLQGNVQGSDIRSLVLLLDGEELANVTSAIDAEGNWQYHLPEGLPQSRYTFSVVATDQYGNASNLTTSPASTVEVNVGPYAPPMDGMIAPSLTNGLEQPFIVPAMLGVLPATSDNPDQQREEDTLGAADEGDFTVDQNAKNPAIAATESGWKLFGVLWYWWLVTIALLVALSSWVMKLVQRQRVQERL